MEHSTMTRGPFGATTVGTLMEHFTAWVPDPRLVRHLQQGFDSPTVAHEGPTHFAMDLH